MQKNKLAMCKRIFKDFQAKKLVDDKNFLVIDWKNKNGSGEYSIRYTLDIEKGNFIVTGDVGYCIASWYNHLTPDNLCKFLNNIGYFKEKINCWTESYTYRYKDIKDDLFVLKNDLLNDTDFSKYYSDWWDSGFSTLGRRISDRIYLWAAGFQMAWKQLSENINK